MIIAELKPYLPIDLVKLIRNYTGYPKWIKVKEKDNYYGRVFKYFKIERKPIFKWKKIY